MFLERDQMSQLKSFLVDPCSWSHYKQIPHLDNSSAFLEYQLFQHESVQQKGSHICQIFNKKQVSTICAILANVMEQSKIDIGKTIDTKLSEDITIARCDTTWVRSNWVMLDFFMLGPPPTNHPHTHPAANLSLPWTSPLETWCGGFTSELHPTLTLSTQEHAGLQSPAKYNTVQFARHRWLPGP